MVSLRRGFRCGLAGYQIIFVRSGVIQVQWRIISSTLKQSPAVTKTPYPYAGFFVGGCFTVKVSVCGLPTGPPWARCP